MPDYTSRQPWPDIPGSSRDCDGGGRRPYLCYIYESLHTGPTLVTLCALGSPAELDDVAVI